MNMFEIKVIYSSTYNARKLKIEKTLELSGSRANVELAEYVYWFLYNNIHLLWKNYSLSLKKKKYLA